MKKISISFKILYYKVAVSVYAFLQNAIDVIKDT